MIVFVVLVADTNNSNIVGKVRIVLIRTDRPRRIDDLSIEVGQHLLEVRALQIDRITTPCPKFVDDFRISVDVESADEPAAIAVDPC